MDKNILTIPKISKDNRKFILGQVKDALKNTTDATMTISTKTETYEIGDEMKVEHLNTYLTVRIKMF